VDHKPLVLPLEASHPIEHRTVFPAAGHLRSAGTQRTFRVLCPTLILLFIPFLIFAFFGLDLRPSFHLQNSTPIALLFLQLR
jgi:hypothetical protein